MATKKAKAKQPETAKEGANAAAEPATVQKYSPEFAEFMEKVRKISAGGPFGRMLIALVVAENSGLKIGEYAQILRVGQSTLTSNIDALERAGWLVRTRSKEDRRSVSLEPSDMAKGLFAELFE